MFVIGVIAFAVASLACGLAPTAEVLIVARILQGIGAALLTPGSLAMIQGAITPADRPRAIGAWSGLGSIAAAIGPFLGGFLVEYVSWRGIFLINLPLAALTVVLAQRHVPESSDPAAARHLDLPGAVLGSAALAGVTYALIDWGTPLAVGAGVAGLLAGIVFIVVERRSPDAMMPVELFSSRVFSATNAMTLLVYAALGALLFFLVLQLQTVLGYGALLAGIATLPITICMLLLASRGGALAARIGARIPLSLGPVIMALGVAGLSLVGKESSYWLGALPPLTLFGLGLAMTVAPLTSTVLAAAPDRRAGIASGINNAVARAGSLLSVAALPVVVGLTGEEYADPAAFDAAYQAAMWICAGPLAAGGVVSWLLIPAHTGETDMGETDTGPADSHPAGGVTRD